MVRQSPLVHPMCPTPSLTTLGSRVMGAVHRPMMIFTGARARVVAPVVHNALTRTRAVTVSIGTGDCIILSSSRG